MYSMVAALGPGALGLMGCELSRTGKPSILVIAVEGLSSDKLSCDAEQAGESAYDGLHSICEESVRFSHAYAPSTQSQPTMASLLTGLYPLDHGVRNNGSDFLAARFRTVAEAALVKQYHTLFVSGGPPIWRKSGLAQGFEIFDDVVEISPGMYYRPVDDVFRVATHWIDHDTGGQPFLAVLFLADLQFPQVATRTNEGEVREKSTTAQLEEIVEALGDLVKWLKGRRLWNTTNIILVGLNGQVASDGPSEPQPLSLRSSSVQVSLFIKPAHRERDNMTAWAVDRNVSLVDVGATIFQWLASDTPAASLSEIQPQSLAGVLAGPAPNWDVDRLILSESTWPNWLEGAGPRWAIRQKEFLYVHDRRPLIYNTLTDRMESLSLRSGDPLWTSLNADILELLRRAQTQPFKGMQPFWIDQLQVARELWRDSNMKRKPKGDETWVKWYLRQALTNRDWHTVRQLARLLGEPVGMFIAARHLGESLPMPRNSCLRLMLSSKGDKKTWQSDCEDERVLALHAWQSAKTEDERLAAQERFTRLYAQTWIDQDIGRLNYLNELRWTSIANGPRVRKWWIIFSL